MTKYAIKYNGPVPACQTTFTGKIHNDRFETADAAQAIINLKFIPENWQVVRVELIEKFTPVRRVPATWADAE